MRTTLTQLALLASLLAACPPAPCQWTNDPWNGMVRVCTAQVRPCPNLPGLTEISWAGAMEFATTFSPQ